jgi:hypothetical protein
MPFEPGRTHRRVVVDRKVNLEFGFGGAACDLYRFYIYWHWPDQLEVARYINHREDNPRQTRTISDEAPTTAPSQPVTRMHIPGGQVTIRYSKRETLGSSAFSKV